WQPYVRGAIARSAAIIVIVGKTPSLGWEISIIRELGRLPNTVLVFPPREAFDADRDFDWEISSIRDGFLPNTALFPPEEPLGADRYWLIGKRILGEALPELPDGAVPIVAFCDAEGAWRVVTSNDRGEIDYQEGLTLAFEMSTFLKSAL